MGENVYKITSKIGAPQESKTAQGGLCAVYEKPLCVTVWRRSQMDGRLCVYDDIEEYLSMTEDIHDEK